LLLLEITLLFLVVAPCQTGASTLSVLTEFLGQDTRTSAHSYFEGT